MIVVSRHSIERKYRKNTPLVSTRRRCLRTLRKDTRRTKDHRDHPFRAAYGGFVLFAYRQRFDRTSKSKVRIVTVVARRSVSLHARVRAFGTDSRVHFAPARLVTRTRPGMRPTGAQSSTGATSSFRSRHRPSATRTFPPRRSSNRSVTPRRVAPRHVASSPMRIALAPVSRQTGNSDIESGRHRSSASRRPLRIRISRLLDLCR